MHAMLDSKQMSKKARERRRGVGRSASPPSEREEGGGLCAEGKPWVLRRTPGAAAQGIPTGKSAR